MSLSNSTFEKCKSNLSGGAVFLEYGNKLVIENNTFNNNKAIARGGAVYLSDMENVLI